MPEALLSIFDAEKSHRILKHAVNNYMEGEITRNGHIFLHLGHYNGTFEASIPCNGKLIIEAEPNPEPPKPRRWVFEECAEPCWITEGALTGLTLIRQRDSQIIAVGCLPFGGRYVRLVEEHEWKK